MVQRVVILRPLSVLYPADLVPDGVHRVAEPVEFRQRLGLGRLDHERPGHRETEGGGVEPVVGQTLGHVLGADSGRVSKLSHVDDHLMRHPALVSHVQYPVVVREPGGQVVGSQNGDLRGPFQTVGAHHSHVHPRDGQDPRRSPGSGRDGADPRGGTRIVLQGMVGEIRRQVGAYRHRTHSRSPSPMRNGKGLVEVEV